VISKIEAEESDPMISDLKDDTRRHQATEGVKMPSFGESPAGVALLCVLAALDCVMARLRVDQAELQEAVTRKFEQAGVKMPEGLVESQDA
jgi:hypothetical protein